MQIPLSFAAVKYLFHFLATETTLARPRKRFRDEDDGDNKPRRRIGRDDQGGIVEDRGLTRRDVTRGIEHEEDEDEIDIGNDDDEDRDVGPRVLVGGGQGGRCGRGQHEVQAAGNVEFDEDNFEDMMKARYEAARDAITISKETMQGYASAFKYYHDERGVSVGEEAERFLNQFVSDYKRSVVADKKHDRSVIDMKEEGKSPLTITADSETGLQASGIPGSISGVACEVAANGERLNRLEEKVRTMREDVLLELKALPSKLVGAITEKFRIEGKHVTRDDLQEIFAAVTARLHGLESRIFNSSVVAAPASIPGPVAPPVQAQGQYGSFKWGGKMDRTVPRGFRFGAVPGTSESMWRLWHHGNAETRVRPYKLIDPGDIEDKMSLSRAHRVMGFLENKAREMGLLDADSDISSLAVEQSMVIFREVFPHLMTACYGKTKPRGLQMSIATLYDRLPKPKKN